MTGAKPELRKFDGSAIPPELMAMRRWAPWKGAYNAERHKFDKVPRNARQPEYGLSTASPEKWFSHDEALQAYIRSRGMLDGIGFVMTDVQGVVGIDLDDCVDGSNVAPWALEVVRSANSYTEVSPSGKGLRIFAVGELDGADWNNHEVGIEVYGGSSARFLTVTGQRWSDAPTEMRPVVPGFLAGLRAAYGRGVSGARQEPKSAVPTMPDILPEMDTPSVMDLELTPSVRDFLLHGEDDGDRSRVLHSAGVALYSAGLTDQQVISVMVHNHHCMEVALSHRRQDIDKAHAYLWEHQCFRAKPKARPRAMTEADFEDLGQALDPADGTQAPAVSAVSADVADDFDDVSGEAAPAAALEKAAQKKWRFEILSADDYYLRAKTLRWFIKGVVPKADLWAMFGASGSGKSFCVIDMLARVALGMDWFGIACEPCRILYVAAEGASGVRNRLLAWCIHNHVEMSELNQRLYILGDQPNLMEKEDVKALVAAARAQTLGVELVVFDTMAQVTPGANENSGEDMGRFLSHARAVGKALRATVGLIAHSGKNTQMGIRGWSGIKGALDAELEVVRTEEFRAVTVTKLKDGEGEGVEYRFALQGVDLSLFQVEEDGLVSSCAVQPLQVFSSDKKLDATRTQAAQGTQQKKKGVPHGKRVNLVMPFLEAKVMSDGPKLVYDAVVVELREHLIEQKAISTSEVEAHKATSLTRAAIESWVTYGRLLLDAEQGLLTVKGVLVEPPAGETCEFL